MATQYGCSLCREFDPEFAIVASSWRKAHPNIDGVFFAKLDFADGRPVFQRVCLVFLPSNLFSLVFNPRPMCGCILQRLVRCRNFPPTINPSLMTFLESEPLAYIVDVSGMEAAPLHRFLQNSIKVPPFPLVKPFNWQRLFGTLFFLLTSAIAVKVAWPQLCALVTNKNTWAVISLVFCQSKFSDKGYNFDVYFGTHV
jgi:oligosaccharyltransferase complex subunit gamma